MYIYPAPCPLTRRLKSESCRIPYRVISIASENSALSAAVGERDRYHLKKQRMLGRQALDAACSIRSPCPKLSVLKGEEAGSGSACKMTTNVAKRRAHAFFNFDPRGCGGQCGITLDISRVFIFAHAKVDTFFFDTRLVFDTRSSQPSLEANPQMHVFDGFQSACLLPMKAITR